MTSTCVRESGLPFLRLSILTYASTAHYSYRWRAHIKIRFSSPLWEPHVTSPPGVQRATDYISSLVIPRYACAMFKQISVQLRSANWRGACGWRRLPDNWYVVGDWEL